jgi:hypothetical protein
MGKNIKNYTSAVPVDRTISCIEQELVKIGVSHIEKSYENGIPVGIIFSVQLPHRIKFRIPVNIDSAFDIIKTIPEYRTKKKDWLKAQACRTAWRIILNWVEVQVAMIQLKQAEAIQIFLPYVYDSKHEQTFYDRISSSGFKMLEYGNE